MAIIDNPVYSGADPEALYSAEGSTFVGIADAIREKRGITAGIPLADMAMQIGLIESGGGSGDFEAASGTFEIAADTDIPTTGYTLPFQMPFKPDYVVVWYDADDFLAMAKPANNAFYRVSATKLPSSVPPIYSSSGVAKQDMAVGGYLFTRDTSANANLGTASPNGYGLAIGNAAVDASYYSGWGISDTGEFSIGRFSTAKPWLYAGHYHWFALKSAGFIL